MITNRELDLIGLRDPIDPDVTGPSADEVAYELVREAPPDRDGWTLRCRRGPRVAWSMPLAPRGAAPRARPAVAQAVAVRVLTEQGVSVRGWSPVADPVEPAHTTEHFVARRPRGAALPV